jgi:hypothetical protein
LGRINLLQINTFSVNINLRTPTGKYSKKIVNKLLYYCNFEV